MTPISSAVPQAKSESLKLTLVGRPLVRSGFAYGLRHPSVTFAVRVEDGTRASDLTDVFLELIRNCDTVPVSLDELDAVADRPPMDSSGAQVLEWLGKASDALGALAGSPVTQKSRVLRVSSDTGLIVVPQLLRSLTKLSDAFQLLLHAANAHQRGGTGTSRPFEEFLIAFKALRSSNPTQSNVPRLIKAAVENEIPVLELNGTSVIQYGVGRRSVVLDSTITEFTSNIGTRLARLKHEGAAILARHRLPVARHALAADADAAARIAEKIGYPVVVKPADRDGGVAVRADLRNESELRSAFSIARAASPRVLVEKFVEGRDYRLILFRGRCVWALERQPAGVLGDGKASVKELVHTANQDPRRGSLGHSPLKFLQLDQEAQELLSREGLTIHSVPEQGTFVRLRRSSNIANGGMPVGVFQDLHPDNAKLAIRAAEALNLDLAGVDMLIPDISVSWKESGAYICEVNAQPQFGGITANHLYAEVLKTLTDNSGRVPVIVCLGRAQAELLSEELAGSLALLGYHVGLHNRSGLYASQALIEAGHIPEMSAGHMLAMDRKIDVVIFGATNGDVLRKGFPLPYIDSLILTGEQIETTTSSGVANSVQGARAALSLLLPACSNVVATEALDAFDPGLRQALSSLKISPTVLNRNRLHHQVMQAIEALSTTSSVARA